MKTRHGLFHTLTTLGILIRHGHGMIYDKVRGGGGNTWRNTQGIRRWANAIMINGIDSRVMTPAEVKERMAGLGKVPAGEDGDKYFHHNLH